MAKESIVCRKIKIHLNLKQKQLFKNFISISNYYYNAGINKIKEYIANKEYNKLKSSMTVKMDIIKRDEFCKKWQCNLPNNSRTTAVLDAYKTYKAQYDKKVKNYNFQYRKDRYNKSFDIDSRAVDIKDDQLYMFSRRLKQDKYIKIANNDLEFMKLHGINHDMKIINKGRQWYLLFLYKRKINEYVEKPNTIVSMDPGVRSFQTIYSPDGIIGKIGEQQKRKIYKLYYRIDYLKSIKDNKKKRTRHNINRRINKLHNKITNIVTDMHKQSINMITNNFNNIILPEFNSGQMQKSDKLTSTTKRLMNTWSHYKFKMRLKEQAEKKGCNLQIVTEEYTTKTCGVCGTVKENVGSAKIYKCSKCNYILERDIHGARNIMIKTIGERCIPPHQILSKAA
jgi:IS605 OrfB family transposase